MIVRWTTFVLALVLFGTTLLLSACESRPGDNAYGRYSNPGSPDQTNQNRGTISPYNDDWYKDRGM